MIILHLIEFGVCCLRGQRRVAVLTPLLAVFCSGLVVITAVGTVGGVGAFLAGGNGGLGAFGAACPVVFGGVLLCTPRTFEGGVAALVSMTQRLTPVALGESREDWGNLDEAFLAEEPDMLLLE